LCNLIAHFPRTQTNHLLPAFDIRYDLYGRGEPEVILFHTETQHGQERISLSEAERRGIVLPERAARARQSNEAIRKAMEKVARCG